MVMLKKGIKINYLLFIVYYLLFTGCYNSNKSKNNNGIENALKSNEYVNNHFPLYSEAIIILNDSVNIYVDSLLKSFTGEYIWGWQVDSMICINSQHDKLVTTLNISSGNCKTCVSDEIIKILGKKINGKWFFFKGGGTLIIPRDMYGKDAVHPLTFHELSQIARKEFLESALIKNDKGEYIVSDKWVDAHFYNAGFDSFTFHRNPGMVSPGEEYQMPRDKEKTDSVHWFLILDKWKHKIDTNEYKPLQRNKMNNLINSFP